MAIYHLSVKPIQRSKGRSATGAAAYRAGICLVDERTGETHDYTRKRGVEHSEIVAPDGEKIDRSDLWNAAEKAEKRRDGTPAREYELALPEELNHGERRELAREFARHLAQGQGCAVDLAVHAPGRGGDQRNHHVHLLCTTRRYEPGGSLGAKCDVELSDTDRQKKNLSGRKAELEAIREKWGELCNAALERAGSKERVDHRSLTAQGIERQPTVHLGPSANGMERRGVQSERGDLNRGAGEEQSTKKELTTEEKMQIGAERMKAQARQWRIEQEQARCRALAVEKINQQEKERREREAQEKQAQLEAQRKAQEQQRREQERAERSRRRGPGMER